MKHESITEQARRRVKSCGATQMAIAAGAGVGQASVSRLINSKGSPSIETVEKVLAWLDQRKSKAVRKGWRKKAVASVTPAETTPQASET